MSGVHSALGDAITPAQTSMLQAHLVVEVRQRHYEERREKLKSAKFHKPGGSNVIGSFDVIDYQDDEFDASAPFGAGIFDKYLFNTEETPEPPQEELPGVEGF